MLNRIIAILILTGVLLIGFAAIRGASNTVEHARIIASEKISTISNI